jgi:dienelactone hydrolase
MTVGLGEVRLGADLTVPPNARGVVLFSPGSRDEGEMVARALNDRGLATLLTPEAEADDPRSAVGMMAQRLIGMIDWLAAEPATAALPIGIFGAGAGAAAGLVAAASRPDLVRAVVSRGGRPDLAGPALAEVLAPTLLLVGERDVPVRQLNQQARSAMTVLVELRVIPGATHLFEEPGARDLVAGQAGGWFSAYL